MRLPFKTCAVVQGNTLPVFLSNIKKAERISPMVELRTDTIKGFKEKDIDAIKKAVKGSSIFTFRHSSEGGEFKGSKGLQQSILKKAFASGFNYVDVAYGNDLIKELSAKEKKKLLLSYHEFEGTSSPDVLKVVLGKMQKIAPSVIKIATFIKKEEDILTLAALLRQKKAKEKYIIIGMGENGKLTRIVFPMMGSYLTYVAMGTSKIAPGLMTVEEMQDIYNFITKT